MTAKIETPAPGPTDDVIIVGGGLAGLFCALRLAPRPVTVLAAAPIGQGASSAWAQGGIAAAMSPGDSVDKHLADTLVAGAGTVDEKIARLMVGDAADRIHDLLGYGVPFDHDLEGHLSLSREAAHSERRIVHVRGDMAGAAIMQALVETVRKTPSIRLMEGYIGETLLTEDGTITGIVARPTAGGSPITFPARGVVLATGGIGHLYAVTTNPPESEGAGLGMAARAGAMIADPEFVQFHPTAINIGRDPAPLATEALRGDGAKLINAAGERFMLKVHPDAELAPRDVVARAIHAEIAAGRGAFLDCREAIGAEFPHHFPTVYKSCMAAGIDPVTQPIPVAPAEHFHMGGVLTDANGRSTLDGLWACGETSSTGAHGANRLASNSLLEAVVFAARVAEDIREHLPQPEIMQPAVEANGIGVADPEVVAGLRAVMAADVGVVRDADGLRRALAAIEALRFRDGSTRFLNMLTTAKLIAAAALARTESRGGHYRSDFPEPDPAWQHRTFITLEDADRIAAGGPTARPAVAVEGTPMTELPVLPRLLVEDAVRMALREDLGRAGDITSAATIPLETRATAVFAARDGGSLAGLALAEAAFREMDGSVAFTALKRDGERLRKGEDVARVEGPARAILSAERVALNYLCHLSGVATATATLVDRVAHTRARICDTRKTLPGLRTFEKYAVRCGGGWNHRYGLDDAVLIKDNHIAVAGGVVAAIERARLHAGHMVRIEVEVESLDMLREALTARPDVIMLDNMAPPLLQEAVALIAGRAVIEASGRITADTVAAVAETGVDYISSGWITHSAPYLDIGLDIRI